MDNANLAALIGSRICHDLISPIGAITNGLELLDMSGNVHGPELDLIAQSVGNAGARIRFFRIAYGASSSQMLGHRDILSVLHDNFGDSRVQVDWTPVGDCPRTLVRLAFLALQCCETALPYGGQITVRRNHENWSVEAASPKLTLDPNLWDRLHASVPAAGLTAAQVQFALLPEAAADAVRTLCVSHGTGVVKFAF
jgi:histidine phosphotransferase ChpT